MLSEIEIFNFFVSDHLKIYHWASQGELVGLRAWPGWRGWGLCLFHGGGGGAV